MDEVSLQTELLSTLELINSQIEEADRVSLQTYGMKAITMRDGDGNYIMAPLIVAKTSILAAMIELKRFNLESKTGIYLNPPPVR